MRRRRFLAVAAGGSAVALAGCFGDGDTDSPRSVVRAYLDAEHDEGDPEAMADLLHSESPLDPTAADANIEAGTLQIEEVVVDDRDLSPSRIGELSMRLSTETARSIGGRENALVDAEYETEPPQLADSGGDGAPSGRITVRNSYLTATENDDWKVVAFQIR